MKFIRKKTMKQLLREKLIKIIHLSDDGEYVRYNILPNGPEIGEWVNFGQELMIVNCKTVHENFVKALPFLFEEPVPEKS